MAWAEKRFGMAVTRLPFSCDQCVIPESAQTTHIIIWLY